MTSGHWDSQKCSDIHATTIGSAAHANGILTFLDYLATGDVGTSGENLRVDFPLDKLNNQLDFVIEILSALDLSGRDGRNRTHGAPCAHMPSCRNQHG